MLQPLKDEQKDLIKKYQESNLSKEKFCEKNGIKTYQLDYLINKQKKISKIDEPVKFAKIEEIKSQSTQIRIKFGNCYIDVEDNFNEELLIKIIKVISNAKL